MVCGWHVGVTRLECGRYVGVPWWVWAWDMAAALRGKEREGRGEGGIGRERKEKEVEGRGRGRKRKDGKRWARTGSDETEKYGKGREGKR